MKNSSKKFTKKIISGKFKGKILNIPSKTTTRSSKTIVLESFFNTLQFDIIDSNFIEVFSGSGSIGLEALSRGARRVTFMEKDKDALKVLKENISLTEPASCEVIAGDSFENMSKVVSRLQKDDDNAYFYIDPPFSIREGMEDIYDKTILLILSLPVNIVKYIIIEHMSGLDIPNNLGKLSKLKSKKFGNTTLTYFSFSNLA